VNDIFLWSVSHDTLLQNAKNFKKKHQNSKTKRSLSILENKTGKSDSIGWCKCDQIWCCHRGKNKKSIFSSGIEGFHTTVNRMGRPEGKVPNSAILN